MSTSTSTPHAATVEDGDDDPNPGIPSASHSVVSKIPTTPPATSPYKLEDSDEDLEYTR